MLMPAPAMLACSFRIIDFIDRTAVNTHPHSKFRMTLQRLADLDRAQDRRFGIGAKDQRTAIAGWQAEQFARCFGDPKLLGCPNDLLERLQLLALLSDEQFGVTDDVDEEDMPDLEPDLFFTFGGHVPRRFTHILRGSVEKITIDNRASQGWAGGWPLRRAMLEFSSSLGII